MPQVLGNNVGPIGFGLMGKFMKVQCPTLNTD